jgi:alkylation response protein AidB-like acyl-CoA dehydrogenase
VDFRDTAEEAAFRTEVRGWLEAKLPPFRERFLAAANSEERLRIAADWQGELFDSGYGALGWPEEYGGRDATVVQRNILVEEQANTGAPWQLNLTVTLGWCAPALLTHGTEDQKQAHLPKMLRADEIWCQMFSEPNAGSDLAALQTRAQPDGDDFVINGQKIWSSAAHLADWGILLTKTSDGPRYRNLTYFIVDMKTPGIEVRPIRQISGEADFCEVFFTDARIPAANVVGEVDAGWAVAIYTLLNERMALSAGAGASVLAIQGLERVRNLARRIDRSGAPTVDHPYFRQRLADVWIQAQANRYTAYRVLSRQFRGEAPGPEASILKLSGDLWTQDLQGLAREMLGWNLLLERGSDLAEDRGTWAYATLMVRALTIGGGTTQVQKNIIAERVLGLPRSR